MENMGLVWVALEKKVKGRAGQGPRGSIIVAASQVCRGRRRAQRVAVSLGVE